MKNKLLYATKHLSLYENKKGFIYAQRRTINSVACLCFRKTNNGIEFLIRYQPLPEIDIKKEWNDLYPCPITGSIEENQTPEVCAIHEVLEEAGYQINTSNIIDKSFCISSTQMNEKVFNFLINVTNCKYTTPKGDGSIFEQVSENKWVNQEELIDIMTNKNGQIFLSSLHSCYLLFLKNCFKI